MERQVIIIIIIFFVLFVVFVSVYIIRLHILLRVRERVIVEQHEMALWIMASYQLLYKKLYGNPLPLSSEHRAPAGFFSKRSRTTKFGHLG